MNLNSSVESAPSKTLRPEFCPCADQAGLVIRSKLPDLAASICDLPSISSSLHSRFGTSIPDHSTAAHWLLNRRRTGVYADRFSEYGQHDRENA